MNIYTIYMYICTCIGIFTCTCYSKQHYYIHVCMLYCKSTRDLLTEWLSGRGGSQSSCQHLHSITAVPTHAHNTEKKGSKGVPYSRYQYAHLVHVGAACIIHVDRKYTNIMCTVVYINCTSSIYDWSALDTLEFFSVSLALLSDNPML